jgi:hypothetical protein
MKVNMVLSKELLSSIRLLMENILWSPTGKARGTHFTPQWGDIPAKGWRIHPRPKAVAFCRRGKRLS